VQNPIGIKCLSDFLFFQGNSVVILTHGFIKKSRKTPADEIAKAEAYGRDFLRRRKFNE